MDTPTPTPTFGFPDLSGRYPYPVVYPTAVAFTAFFALFLGLFLYRRDQEPIRSRGWPLVLCSAVASWVFFVFDTVDFDINNFSWGQIAYTCYQDAFISGMFLPMWFYPYFYRTYLLYVKFRLNDEGLQVLEKERLSSWVFRYRWTLEFRTFIISYVVLGVVCVLVNVAVIWTDGVNMQPLFYMGFGDCLNNVRIFVGVQGGFIIVSIIVSIIFLWRVRDAFGFKLELTLILLVAVPIFVVWIIESLGPPFPPQLPSLVWELLLVFVTFIVSVCMPFVLTFSPKFNSAIMNSSRTSTDLSTEMDHQSITAREFHEPGSLKFFIDMLDDPVLSEEFKQFCVELWCVENVIFYYAATSFAERQFSDNIERFKQAQIIYDRFIKPSAPQELNIEANVRERIFEAISGDPANVPPNLFSDALKKVFTIMRTDTYKKFLQSSRFLNSYLNSPIGLAGGDAAVAWMTTHRSDMGAFRSPKTIHKPRRFRQSMRRKATEDEPVMLNDIQGRTDSSQSDAPSGSHVRDSSLRTDIP